MRVYLAATIPLLARLERDGGLESLEGCAATASLRAWYGEGDEEEYEYVAMNAASHGSLRLLAESPGAPRRRVVIAADVPDSRVVVPGGESADPGVIKVTGVVRLADIASLHVDEVAAEQAVSAAIEALPAADEGDPGAVTLVADAEDYDLLWYVTQELPDLL
jgi:hypothetical protein